MNRALPALNTERLQTWGPKLASVILVLCIAYALVQIVWLFAAPTAEPEPANTATPIKAPTKTGIRTANQIAGLHIFGKADVKTAQAAISAPETKLNLQLRGILAIGGEDGLAIIAAGASKEDFYKVGDRIPGNATLKAVYADRVLLESSRGLETLRLPTNKELIRFSGSASQNNIPVNNPPITATTPGSLKEYRRQFLRNPASLAEMARVTPSKINGEMRGYKVIPQSDDPLFGALGLEPGDIITDVNGIKLDKPENGMKALRNLMKAKSLNVTVLRNGQETNLQHRIE